MYTIFSANSKHVFWSLLFMLILCLSHMSSAQVIAAFEMNTSKGCSPMLVQFTNTSQGSDVSYYWDLGNGNFSTLENPYGSYVYVGSYNVVLTVTNGEETDTFSQTVTVFPDPQVQIAVTKTEGCVPLEIGFTNTSDTNELQSTIWDFGDGNMSNEASPSHLYTLNGQFQVSLISTDSNGCVTELSIAEPITVHDIPNAEFTADKTLLCDGSNVVSFAHTSSEQDIIMTCWIFGDGNFSFDLSPVNVYSTSGEFDVQLILVDSNYCVAKTTKEKYIKAFGDIAYFELSSDTICKDETLDIGLNTHEDIQYTWDFGNGQQSNQPMPEISYEQHGDYTLKLSANLYQQCYSEFSTQIHIPQVVAEFSNTPDFICHLPIDISYQANGLNIANWDWRLERGNPVQEEDPIVHIDGGFAADSNYKLTDSLIVTDTHGCKDTIVNNYNREVSLLKSCYTLNNLNGMSNQLQGCAPLTIQFIDASTYPTTSDMITSYHWDFGDGSTSAEPSPIHIFYDPGEYDVSLTVFSGAGCQSVFVKEVRVGTPQTAFFSVSDVSPVCASDQVFFKNESTDGQLINNWYWDMGDGTVYHSSDVSHAFLDTGYMDVSLTVYYNGCQGSTYTINQAVYVDPPVGRFSEFFSCNDVYNYAFMGTLIGADQFSWDFGDGSAANNDSQDPNHVFPGRGDYTVSLSCENITTGCTHVFSKEVKVREPIAVIQKDRSVACKKDQISFNASQSTDYTSKFNQYDPYNFKWIIEETEEEFFMLSENWTKTFANKGEFTIKLIIEDINSCTDTTTTKIKIYKPEAGFVADNQIGCTPFTVNFTNNTISDTTYTIDWCYGDGTLETGTGIQEHIYTEDGTYSPSVLVTDVVGCTSTIVHNDYILSTMPHPIAQISSHSFCLGEEISFGILNSYTLDTIIWDMGDGQNYSAPNGAHVYPQAGNYEISLYTEDRNGCGYTLVFEDTISVHQYPTANFTGDKLSGNCYPFHVMFENLTQSNEMYTCYWEFGDGENVSGEQNPEHYYMKPGEYTVSLTASTLNGCADTMHIEKMITVTGPYAEIIAPDHICRNESFEFSFEQVENVYSYRLDMGDGSTFSDSIVNYFYSGMGNVYPSVMLQGDSLNTCEVIIMDTIYVSMLLASYITETDTYCVNSPLGFDNISYGAQSYSWLVEDEAISNDFTPVYAFPEAGEYHVVLIASDGIGCSDTTSKTFIINDVPRIIAQNDTLICEGDDLFLNARGGISYQWFTMVNDSLVSSSKHVQPDLQTIYQVIGIDSNGCVNNDLVIVDVQPYLSYWVSEDTSIIIGDPVELNAGSEQNLLFHWSTNASVICTHCTSLLQAPQSNTYYTLQIQDTNQCFTEYAGVDVQVIESYTLDLPDAFTPDGDGINDVVYARGNGIRKLNYLKIFNQWGDLVFESNSLEHGWDGSFKGEMQGIDMYTYIAEAEMLNGAVIFKKGALSIIR